jgi:tRNA(adenine34) deaminase
MNANDMAAAREHEHYMRRCIELARIAQSRNNSPVGSVVVIDGEIMGEGIEDLPAGKSITGHAEAIACQDAVDRTGNRLLHRATLYTTAEPCFMCSYIIRQCGVTMVVYGLDTPNVGGVTSPMPILSDPSLSDWMPPPRIVQGVLRDECQKLKSTKIEHRGNTI